MALGHQIECHTPSVCLSRSFPWSRPFTTGATIPVSPAIIAWARKATVTGKMREDEAQYGREGQCGGAHSRTTSRASPGQHARRRCSSLPVTTTCEARRTGERGDSVIRTCWLTCVASCPLRGES